MDSRSIVFLACSSITFALSRRTFTMLSIGTEEVTTMESSSRFEGRTR